MDSKAYTLMLKPFPKLLANRARARAALRGIPLREYVRLALEERISRDEKADAKKLTNKEMGK